MTAQLVFSTFNGRVDCAVEYFPARKAEGTLGAVTCRLPLTDAESNLSLDQLRTLFDVKALKAQRGAG